MKLRLDNPAAIWYNARVRRKRLALAFSPDVTDWKNLPGLGEFSQLGFGKILPVHIKRISKICQQYKYMYICIDAYIDVCIHIYII